MSAAIRCSYFAIYQLLVPNFVSYEKTNTFFIDSAVSFGSGGFCGHSGQCPNQYGDHGKYPRHAEHGRASKGGFDIGALTPGFDI